MDAKRYSQVEALFNQCCDLAPDERDALLNNACAGDNELRNAVENLLRHDRDTQQFDEDRKVGAMAAASLAMFDAESEAIPQSIGPYRVIRKLGSGGMGVVYLAEQDQPRRQVAVKVLRPMLFTRESFRRFEFEAQVLGKLQHPGIAHIYDAGTIGSDRNRISYFAMEYVDGVALTEYARQKNLDVRTSLELIARICDAVHHAHQKGVIHRDLKPANILVVGEGVREGTEAPRHGGTEGNRRDRSTSSLRHSVTSSLLSHTAIGQPKILDFGVARATDGDVQAATMQTDVGQLIGTIPYMSPEQVTGVSSDIDTRSDVYALGAVAFELLASKLPLDLRQRSIPEAARMIREDEPTRLGTVNTACRGDIEVIVAKALEKDRSRRYQSAAEFADDIRRYLRDEPIAAKPATFFYQLQKFSRRNKGLVAGIALAIVAMMIGTGVAVWQAVEARSAQHIAEKRFHDVQELANTVIYDFYDAIRPLNGSLEASQLLIETALKYANNLAEQGVEDQALAHDLVGAYLRIGQMQGHPHHVNVGDTEGALASYRKALELAQDAAERWPDNPTAQRDLGLGHEAVASLHIALGRLENVEAHLRKYAEIAEQLKNAFPPAHAARRDPGLAHNKLGRLYENQGDLVKAQAEYKKSYEARLLLANDQPEYKMFQMDLAKSQSKLGDIHLRLGELDEALKWFRESHAMRERYVEGSRNEADAVRTLSLTHGRIGQALLSLGRYEEARTEFEAYRNLRQGLVKSNPGDARAKRDLAVAHYRLGEFNKQIGNYEQAANAFGQFVGILEELSNESTNDARALTDLASGHFQLGSVLLETGEVSRALESLNHSVELADAAVDVAPDRPEAKLVRIMAQSDIGLALTQQQDLERAITILKESWAKCENEFKDASGEVDVEITKSQVAMRLGDAYTQLAQASEDKTIATGEHLDAAIEHYRSCLSVLNRLDQAGILPPNQVEAMNRVRAVIQTMQSETPSE
ncbi:MAG: protein kinase [Phycisphaerae bacterium]|nr:protein kinase [Phycisphaerales bacterium]